MGEENGHLSLNRLLRFRLQYVVTENVIIRQEKTEIFHLLLISTTSTYYKFPQQLIKDGCLIQMQISILVTCSH